MTKKIVLLSAVVVQSFLLSITLYSTSLCVLTEVLWAIPNQLPFTPFFPRLFISFCETLHFIGIEIATAGVFCISLVSGVGLVLYNGKMRIIRIDAAILYLAGNLMLCQLLLLLCLLTMHCLGFEITQ